MENTRDAAQTESLELEWLFLKAVRVYTHASLQATSWRPQAVPLVDNEDTHFGSNIP